MKYQAHNDRKLRQRFYQSEAWRQIRDYKLSQDPLCECSECKKNALLTPANEVHHVVDIAEDWARRLELDNLQSMYKPHHSRETMKRNNERRAEQIRRRKEFESKDRITERLADIVNKKK